MNPLKSIPGTIASGFVIAVVISLMFTGINWVGWSFVVWLHVLAGITWIGLLYYFNFVQVPATAEAIGNTDGPGPAAISKYIAPKALLWFRWGAVVTWITGALALQYIGGFTTHFFAIDGVTPIGIGAWLGTIMLFNVWILIWPNQKKILGMVEASSDEIAKAKNVALLASRTNTLLSVPMVMCMVAHGHGLPL